MGGMLERMEDRGPSAVGEVEFAGGGGGEVVWYDAIDFGAEGLDCDFLLRGSGILDIGCREGDERKER